MKLMVSYPHSDRLLVNTLCSRLFENLRGIDPGYESWLDFQDLQLGMDWDLTIRSVAASIDGAVLMLTPGFHVSDYIRLVELPLLAGKPLFPVMVVSCAATSLPHLQTFYLVGDKHGPKTFEECKGHQRSLFCAKLADAIHRRMAGLGAAS